MRYRTDLCCIVLSTLLAAVPCGALRASELADRIQRGERSSALALIDAGVDVNEAQGDGTTPLHWAVYRLDAELATLLLERGARADGINNYGSSPLAEAVKAANRPLVELLLAAGADAEAPNADGQTALMLAARSGSVEIAQLLIDHGADVNARESWRGQTALIWAADSRFPDIVDLLIEHGANVDFRADSFDWPSQITSEPRAQYRPVGGLTPLLYAARSGCTDCVASILDAGADIDRPTPEGMTALMVAIDNEALDTAALLLDRGANPHLWDWYGRTALYVAADKSTLGRRGGDDAAAGLSGLSIMQRLLEAGVDPNPQLNMHRPSPGGNMGRFTDDLLTTGATPLLRVAASQDIEAMRLLLGHGADVDLPNVMGVTPLIAVAGLRGARGGVFGADFGSQASAISALDLLLAAGADVNARVVDEFDRTGSIGRESQMTMREAHSALFAAVTRGWRDVVDYLIENGAAIDVVDTRGYTLVDAALGRIDSRCCTDVYQDLAEHLMDLADQ